MNFSASDPQMPEERVGFGVANKTQGRGVALFREHVHCLSMYRPVVVMGRVKQDGKWVMPWAPRHSVSENITGSWWVRALDLVTSPLSSMWKRWAEALSCIQSRVLGNWGLLVFWFLLQHGGLYTRSVSGPNCRAAPHMSQLFLLLYLQAASSSATGPAPCHSVVTDCFPVL